MESVQSQKRIYEFNFKPEEVGISKEELLSLLGYSGKNFPHHLDESIFKCLDMILNYAQPTGGFIIFAKEDIKIGSDHIYINNVRINSERIITSYFRKVEKVAVLVATIGREPEKYSKQYMNEGDPITGYISDIALSEIVEKIADLIELKLNNVVSLENHSATNRYSPGYCGWNVSDQHKLFSLLPPGFCGITLNDSAMMMPVKSISALIGIGRDVKKEEYECEICDIDFCYKKDRRFLSK